MREAEDDTRVRTSRCLSYCAMNIHSDNALFPSRRPAPSLSQLCQAAFCTTQFKQSALKRQRNQTKSGAGESSSAPLILLASPPLVSVLGFLESPGRAAPVAELVRFTPLSFHLVPLA